MIVACRSCDVWLCVQCDGWLGVHSFGADGTPRSLRGPHGADTTLTMDPQFRVQKWRGKLWGWGEPWNVNMWSHPWSLQDVAWTGSEVYSAPLCHASDNCTMSRVRTVHEKTDRTQYPSFRPQFRPTHYPIRFIRRASPASPAYFSITPLAWSPENAV